MDGKLAGRMQQAFAYFQNREWQKSEQICRQVLNQVPNQADTLQLLGLVLKQQNRLDEAHGFLVKSTQHSPKNPEFCANLGNLQVQRGLLTDAIQAYEQSLTINPAHKTAQYGLLRTLIKQQAWSSAERRCRLFLEQQVADAQLWLLLGDIQRSLRKQEEALDSYQKAIALAKDYGLAHHNLGALLAEMDQPKKAMSCFQQARVLGIKGPILDFNLASSLLGQGLTQDCHDVLAESLNAYPSDLRLVSLLSKTRYMLGIKDFADVSKALYKSQPDNPQVVCRLGQILRGAEQLSEAQSILQDHVKKHPSQPEVWAELSVLKQESGDFENSLTAAQKALELQPEHLGYLSATIDPLLSLGRGEEAWEFIQKGRQLAPLNQWFIATESSAARLLDRTDYGYLCDYQRFVQTYTLERPDPWLTLEAYLAELKQHLLNKHVLKVRPLDQSLRNGLQTPGGLLSDDTLVVQAFFKAIKPCIEHYRACLPSDSRHPLLSRNHGTTKMTGCWSVLLGRNGFHVNHVHSQGWISSAFYVHVPTEVSDTEKKSGWLKFGEPRFTIPDATPERMVQPKDGLLVLFPSYFWHGTNAITESNERLTIAFDLISQ